MAKNKWLILLAVVLFLAAVPAARAAETGSIQVQGIEGPVALYGVASPEGTVHADFAEVYAGIPDDEPPHTLPKFSGPMPRQKNSRAWPDRPMGKGMLCLRPWSRACI